VESLGWLMDCARPLFGLVERGLGASPERTMGPNGSLDPLRF